MLIMTIGFTPNMIRYLRFPFDGKDPEDRMM